MAVLINEIKLRICGLEDVVKVRYKEKTEVFSTLVLTEAVAR